MFDNGPCSVRTSGQAGLEPCLLVAGNYVKPVACDTALDGGKPLLREGYYRKSTSSVLPITLLKPYKNYPQTSC